MTYSPPTFTTQGFAYYVDNPNLPSCRSCKHWTVTTEGNGLCEHIFEAVTPRDWMGCTAHAATRIESPGEFCCSEWEEMGC